MRVTDSARLFIRGPVWMVGGAVSILFSLATLAELLRGAPATRILALICIALAALVIVSFWSFHRSRMEMEARKESLPHQIDDLHREGIDLLVVLRTPVKPETKNGVTTISGEWPPDEWWEKVETFEQRIRDLFIARYPGLLSDYASEAEAKAREQREKAVEPPPLGGSKGATTAKMLAFANHMHRGPARRLETSLYGLTAARHRVAASQALV